MNYLDIIILTPLLWGIYKGFSRGLVVEVASLAALILGVWCAMHFSENTADILINDLDLNISSTYIGPVSFAVTFLAVALAIVFVSRMIDKLLSAIALGSVNRVLGAIFGAAKVLLILSIITYYVNNLDSKYKFIDETKKEESFIYLPLVDFINEIVPQINIEEIKSKAQEIEI